MNILITGATSGIGLLLAKSYLKDGHKVIAIGRNIAVLDELSKLGIYTVAIDLVDLELVREKFKAISADFECIDIAILNAGNCEYLDVQNFDASLIRRVFDANIISLANSIEAVLPLLRKSKVRHLVGVASMAGYLPLSRAEAYGASKAAANYMLETLAIDLVQDKILVSVVNPGFVKTPLTAKNDFPMPFALEVDAAVKIIKNGILRQKAEIHFPYRLTLIIKLLSLLPRSWWRILGQKFKK
jgi:short-subunit dehydrogenase